MQVKITKRVVDATAPGPKDVFLWDTEVKGFGLKVTPAGGKVYIVQYRPKGAPRASAPKRFTLGRHGSPWTPDDARREAKILLGEVENGADPQKQKRAERSAAEQAQAETFAKLADDFIDRYAKRKTRSWETTKGHLDRHVIPHWGKRPAAEISKRDVNKLLNDLVAAGTPILANRVLAAVRKLYAWAVEEGEVETSPCVGVKPKAEEQDRERVLTDAELVEVWRAASAIGQPFGPFIKLLTLTLQRRDEVAGMRWDELDLEAKVWALPGKRAKNAKPNLIPLPALAVEILNRVPRVEVKPGEPSPFVLTTTGATPISGYSRAKNTLDRLVLEARQKAAEERGEAVETVKELEDWRFHDLRRTGATGLTRMRVPKEIRERVLNHVEGRQRKGVAEVYDRWGYLDEKRAALDVWARHIDQLVNGTPDNVVELRPAVA